MCTATVAARGDAAVSRSGEVTGVASGAPSPLADNGDVQQMVRVGRARRADYGSCGIGTPRSASSARASSSRQGISASVQARS
jgi:hypothetical protein